ncbi:MAG: tetratricopeptide repeat protein [Planctomycetota bacterium]|jgi:Tfp pilus assembly protein PilF
MLSRMGGRAAVATSLALMFSSFAVSGCATTSEEEELAIDVYLQNAQGYVDGGHHDQALAQFRRALQIDSSHTKARLGEAMSLYQMGLENTPGGGRRALEAVEKFGDLNASRYGQNAWKIHLGDGMARSRVADLWDLQAARLEGDAQDGDTDAIARIQEARASAAKLRDQAEASFKRVLQYDDPLAKDNLAALFFLATRSALRAESPEGYEEAIGYMRRYEVHVKRSKQLWITAAEQEPDLRPLYERRLKRAERQEIELRDLLANIYFKRRDHKKSLEQLDIVLELDRDRADAYFNRGRNHEELGRFGAAADDYRRFIGLTTLPPTSALVVEAAERQAKCEAQVRRRMNR